MWHMCLFLRDCKGRAEQAPALPGCTSTVLMNSSDSADHPLAAAGDCDIADDARRRRQAAKVRGPFVGFVTRLLGS